MKKFITILTKKGARVWAIVGSCEREDEMDKHLEAEAARALKNGNTIRWMDQTEEWLGASVDYDGSKYGTKAYTWKGGKVKFNRYHYTKTPDGEVTRKLLGTSWREFTSI